ncbi:MAG: type I toxin-antitoxin system SymE family toxin [Candidatus Azobacteroides sp.]|nr:type I toxin-antitoxin system SymE family toxin [Candidatus Azobacteroides sp.]
MAKAASGILVARSFKPHVCKAPHEKHVPVITHYAAPDVKPRHFYGCRHLTLCSRSTRNRANKWSEYPVSKLQGKWMHNAGFRPGQTVEVKVYHQKLIVRVVRQREENFPDKGNW